MKAIIGTAGHIDHGKTALVRALTGIDTDRLPEEQRRGISIELGFAYLELPGGDRVGIVDVPGHERFVRQMLAGAQGFDLLLLVVAADDGVMPQSEEHFEICHLLGVRKAIFVITKADMVAENRILDVSGEIEILAAGTPFEGAPVIAVSAQTGRGIETLRQEIIAALADLERPSRRGPFRMPVDRAFVLKGHGVVVTGTAAGGSVAAGDEVVIAPAGTSVRVREVQVHEQAVERAFAGQRTALNLAGVDREAAARGDTIVAPGVESETRCFDARVEIRPSARKPLKTHTRVRVYVGTREVAGRLKWLGEERAVAPRSSAYAQIALEEAAVAFAGDRFVLRDETASHTLGGGVVIMARARKHRAADSAVNAALADLENGEPGRRLLAFVCSTPGLGCAPAAIACELGMETSEVMRLAEITPELTILRDGPGDVIASRADVERCVASVVEAVRAHHERHPSLPGIDLEALRHLAAPQVEARLFRVLVDRVVSGGAIERRGSIVALSGHRVSMSDADEKLAEGVLGAIRAAASMPPTLKQLEESFGVPSRRMSDVVAVLAERGAVVKVSADLVFSREVVEDIEQRLRAYLQREREITAAGFRDLIDASRKYSIPLLDYFDRVGITLRSGDLRRLRGA